MRAAGGFRASAAPDLGSPLGVPHKIVAGEFCKPRFDIELPPSDSASSVGCPPLPDEASVPPPTQPFRKSPRTARTPPILPASSSGRSSFAIGRRGSLASWRSSFRRAISLRRRAVAAQIKGGTSGVKAGSCTVSARAASTLPARRAIAAVATAAPVASKRRRLMFNGKISSGHNALL